MIDGGGLLFDNGRAVDAIARLQLRACVDACIDPPVLFIDIRPSRFCGERLSRGRRRSWKKFSMIKLGVNSLFFDCSLLVEY